MMRREKKLTLLTGGCPFSGATVNAINNNTIATATSPLSSPTSPRGCDAASSSPLAGGHSPANGSLSKHHHHRQHYKPAPPTPPPLISPPRTILTGSGGGMYYPPYSNGHTPTGNGFTTENMSCVHQCGQNGLVSGVAPSTPPYLPLHSLPYSAIGVASPPSPRCYDIIEEEMIFPMSDITEEDEEHCSNTSSNKSNNSKNLDAYKEECRVKSPLTIPTIITEDVDSDKVSTSNDSTEESNLSWSNLSGSNHVHQNGNLRKSVSGGSSHQHRCASPPESTGTTSKSTSANSVTTMSSTEATHPSHYHTVHGTNNIGHHHYYQASTPTSTITTDGSSSPVYGPPSSAYCSKQRTRSHSGPTYPVGFTQQVRHSALISAGMATLGASTRRRQSDDSEQQSSSLRSRVSPSGSSFFDSFRPRSTSDSKSKKPSVIAAIKNNFLNRGNNTNGSSSSSSSSSSSNSSTNVNSNGCANAHQCHHNQQHHHAHHHPSVHYQAQQHSPQSVTTSLGSATSCASCASACTNGSCASVVDQQPNGSGPPPLSPGSAVIDPFSLDYLYARNSSANCSECSLHSQHNFNQPPVAVPIHHHHHHSHNQRPRSRSGSSGPTSTMARVFDMIRGRSNSIAATNAAGINAETAANCCARPTISHQDSICDREFEDIDENLVYVKFFRFYRCYDIIPISAKLVVFDTQLAVKKAFFALLSNGVRAAPLWDSSRHAFVGMLTITDFILILRSFYNSPHLKMEELEDHKLDIWRNMLKEKTRPLVSIEPDESLFNAIKMLIHNKVHRLPVIDPETGNVLYILTHKRILKFLFLYYYTRLPMPSFLMKTLRDFPQIGTYDNIAVATQNTPLIEALNMMVDKRVSALPIVDKKNKVVEVYAKFDVIHLAADKMYQNLDITVKKALEYRAQSERIVKCTLNESLHSILERIVTAEVHRIIVVDNDDHVIGIISLSDLLTFLVLRPVGLERASKQQSNPVQDLLTSQLVRDNIKCCKVVEETAEEVLSDSQSGSDTGGSTPDLMNTDRRCPPLVSDGLAGSLDDTNQLTTSSTGSSSATSSSSSMLVDDQRSPNASPAGSTANNLSNMMANNVAKQTLIAPLQ